MRCFTQEDIKFYSIQYNILENKKRENIGGQNIYCIRFVNEKVILISDTKAP